MNPDKPGEEWVLVESVNELRPGLVVKVLFNVDSHKSVVDVLLRRCPRPDHANKSAWVTIASGDLGCLRADEGIPGLIYRLADSQTSEDSTDATVTNRKAVDA